MEVPGSAFGRAVSELAQSTFKGTERGGNPQRSATEFKALLDTLLGDPTRSGRGGDLGPASSAVATPARSVSTSSPAAAPATVVQILDERSKLR